MVTRAVVVLGLFGCAYNGGSYAGFTGKLVQLGGCLDIGVAMASDERATGRVVHYEIGNGCWEPAVVDLASVRAYTTDGGVRRQLHAYDPRRELRPLRVEPKWSGDESIEYVDDLGDLPATICIDIGGLDRSAPPTGEHWVCLAHGGAS